MMKVGKKQWLVFAVVFIAGILLHFLYSSLPNPVTALISPVNESLWEHGKLLFWPLLAAAFWLGGSDGPARAVRQLSAVLASIFVIAAGYVYHILLGGEARWMDITLYALAMLLGFLLPRVLSPLTKGTLGRRGAAALTFVMAVLFIYFTFRPPEAVLFADLEEGVRTFLTIPV